MTRKPPPIVKTTNTNSAVGSSSTTNNSASASCGFPQPSREQMNNLIELIDAFPSTPIEIPHVDRVAVLLLKKSGDDLVGGSSSVDEGNNLGLISNVSASFDKDQTVDQITEKKRKLSENAALNGGSSSSFVDDNASASSSDNDQTVDQTEKKRKFNESRKKKK